MCDIIYGLIDMDVWIALASPLLAIISIGIAIYSTRKTSEEVTKQIEEIRKSTEKQIEALKDIIEYHGHMEYGRLEYYRAKSEFKLKQDENELAILQVKIENAQQNSNLNKVKELELEAKNIQLRIKNRKIFLDNLQINFQFLDRATASILFDVDIFKNDKIKTCHNWH